MGEKIVGKDLINFMATLISTKLLSQLLFILSFLTELILLICYWQNSVLVLDIQHNNLIYVYIAKWLAQ